MSEFFTGVVEEAYIGAEYEGVVWSRFVKLRASDGRILNIFDADLFSKHLVVGETCTLMIAAILPINVRGFEREPAEKEPAFWEGTIINLNWRAPQRTYRYIQEHIYGWNGIALVETPLGQILMFHDDLPVVINGAFLQWDDTPRFDLYAIL